jgi:hypothetical protein
MNNDPENGTQQLELERDGSDSFPSPTMHDSWNSANYDATISWSWSNDWIPGQAITSGTWSALGSGEPGPSGIVGQDGVVEGNYIKAMVHLPTYGNYFFRAKAYDGTNFSLSMSDVVNYHTLDNLSIASITPFVKSYEKVISSVVSGTNFTASTSISLGSVVLSSVYTDTSHITVRVPNTLFVGSHNVIAQDPNYLSASIIGGFYVTAPAQEIPVQLISPIDYKFVDISSAEFNLVWYSLTSPSAVDGGTCQFQVQIDSNAAFDSQVGSLPLMSFATGADMDDYTSGVGMEYSLDYNPDNESGNWAPSGEGAPSLAGTIGVNGSPATTSCFNRVTISMLTQAMYYWRVREWTGEKDAVGENIYNDWSTAKVFMVGTPSVFNYAQATGNRIVKKNGKLAEIYKKSIYTK